MGLHTHTKQEIDMSDLELSLVERLNEQEAVIRTNLDGFVQTVTALGVIKEEGLYFAAGYSDFKAYCQERWNMSYSTFQRQATAAAVASQLDMPDDAKPLSQAALLGLGQAEQPQEVYDELVKNEQPVTGLTVQATMKLQALEKRSAVLADKVRQGQLAVDLAMAVQDEIDDCAKLPKNGVALARAVLQHGIYNVEVIKTLRSLEYWGQSDELADIIASGMVYVNGTIATHVNEVTADDIRRLRNRLSAEAKKATSALPDTEIATAENRVPNVYGDVAMVQVAVDGFERAHQLLDELEEGGYEIFTLVATKGQPPLKGLDGRPTTRAALNGSTPAVLRRNAEGLVYQ